ncbi:MAG: hypothetical protein V3V99_03140 [candidate division Zixibacteria bacterium]
MEPNMEYIAVAIVLAILIPLVPYIVKVRIRVLNWLRLKGLAKVHEKGFRPIVITIRSLLLVLAVYLLLLGFNVV